MKIRNLLISVYAVVALLPLFGIVWVNYRSTETAYVEQEFSNLTAIVEARTSAIKEYMYSWERLITIIQDDNQIKTNLPVLVRLENTTNDQEFQSAKHNLDQQLRAWRNTVEEVMDVLLVSPDGTVVFADDHRITNGVRKTLYDPTNTVMQNAKNGVFISSLFIGKDNEPKFFVAAPIYDVGEEFVGIVIFEVNAYKLYAIIQDTTGLGTTGETEVAQLVGNSVLFLNPLRFNSDAAFTVSLPFSGEVLNNPAQRAVLGDNDQGFVVDYRGRDVLAVWRYIPSLNWGLVTKIDQAEVLVPAQALGRWIIAIVSILSGIILFCVWIMATYVDKLVRSREEIGKKSEAILQGIGDAVFVVDPNLIIQQFNRVAVEMTGISEKDALGKHYKQVMRFISEETGEEKDVFITEALKAGAVRTRANHTLLLRNDGVKIPIEENVAPLVNHEGSILGVVVMFEDVTKEREIDNMKTDFISIASHQLRTPLTGIKWATELLLKDRASLSDKQQEYLDRIHSSEEHMVDLVKGLLNVNRLESGTISIQPVSVDLGELVRSLGKDVSLVAEKEGVYFETRVPTEPIVTGIDKDIFGIIVQNLVSNAMKYSNTGGEITLSLSSHDQRIALSVTDTGIGIPVRQQSQLFQKFFRADNAILSPAEGTGLGLYVTKTMVEQAGGTLTFVSAEGKGSTFTVEFPLSGMAPHKGTKKPETVILIS
ncbi:hypothetical protein COV06_00525 [Candidatus Uhrbacteria bacterium CG10_big_fil_rev_8_21_14_0_10_50_16]|uniref:histidine kinase n=1 Tax=Candidatus Uhrbacteria bacterium CG10_big_fil_rev_8_21_14_0_10_50_16 TaxID=1975039 RepID=A0A2H0RMV0_9BACT|nr:MAG: hypothetical protein COV06_00525 [Candidatus Uhrbacteria bacterium CG10_big_fil_rev_8_21_14_0_10_50_16]